MSGFLLVIAPFVASAKRKGVFPVPHFFILNYSRLLHFQTEQALSTLQRGIQPLSLQTLKTLLRSTAREGREEEVTDKSEKEENEDSAGVKLEL